MKVRDCMSTNVRTIRPHDSALEARRQMREHCVHQLPVLDGTAVIGIVTDRDVRDAFPGVFADLGPARHRPLGSPDEIPVDEIMSSFVYTVSSDADVLEAVAILREHRIGALPVVEEGRLAGILTRSDVLDWILSAAPAPEAP